MWPLPCRHKNKTDHFRITGEGWKIFRGWDCPDCGAFIPNPASDPKSVEQMQKMSDAYQWVMQHRPDFVGQLFWRYWKFMYGGKRRELVDKIRDTLHI